MNNIIPIKQLLLLSLLCLYSATAYSQCNEQMKKYRDKGIDAYNKGQYKEAVKYFDAAKCPGISYKDSVDLNNWIEKCNNATKRGVQGSSSTEKKPPVPPKIAKGEVEYSHVGCSTICNDQGGISLKLCFQVKGMKGKKIGVRCLFSPERGRPLPRREFDVSGNYSVFGGRLGIEKEYTVSTDEEYFSETYFIPFAVMDFGGEYVTQALEIVSHVFEPCKNADMENMNPIKGGTHHEKFSVTPTAFTIDGSTKNRIIPVDSDGGLYAPKIGLCGCDIQWKGEIPYWITIDRNGTDLHVSQNKSSQQREATLRIESDAGWGNVITIKIKQRGL